MGNLPVSRTVTLNPSDPVPSALLDEIEDCIIGKKYQGQWVPQTLGRGWVETNVAFGDGIGNPAGIYATAPAGLLDGIPVHGVEEGTRVTGIKAAVHGTGGVGNVVITLYLVSAGARTPIGVLTIVNPPNAWAEYTLDPIGTIHTMASGESLQLRADIALAAQNVESVSIKRDRL